MPRAAPRVQTYAHPPARPPETMTRSLIFHKGKWTRKTAMSSLARDPRTAGVALSPPNEMERHDVAPFD